MFVKLNKIGVILVTLAILLGIVVFNAVLSSSDYHNKVQISRVAESEAPEAMAVRGKNNVGKVTDLTSENIVLTEPEGFDDSSSVLGSSPVNEIGLNVVGIADFEESISYENLRDILSLNEVFIAHLFEDFDIEELFLALRAKGYRPEKQKRGHPDSGFRHVITLIDDGDFDGIIREFYSSYRENDDNDEIDKKIEFDKFYFGLQEIEGLFEYQVRKFDDSLRGKYLSKIVKPNFIRWNFSEGKFLFVLIRPQFRDGENIILVGQEYEIHPRPTNTVLP